MSGDVFHRVGRGGAGNWYNKKDVEDVEKLGDGVEAPKPSPAEQGASPAVVQASPAPYARGGRGGAGNFFNAQSAAAAAAAAGRKDDAAARLETATAAASARPRKPAAYSGRGGAGNWTGTGTGTGTGTASEHEEVAEQQRQQQAVIEAQVRQDVEAGLAMPAPAYHGSPARDGKKGPAPDGL